MITSESGFDQTPRVSSATHLKTEEPIRRYALMLAAAIGEPAQLTVAIEELGVILRATVRQNKRKKPSTFWCFEISKYTQLCNDTLKG